MSTRSYSFRRFRSLLITLLLLGGSFAYTHIASAATTTDTFTANGSWTAPAGVTRVIVEAWGGGGGSAGGANGACCGGGGGGGAFAQKTVTVIPGTSYTVVVGIGGTAGASTPTAGGSGQDSMFSASSTILAKGGGGGQTGNNGAGGTAGSGSTGDITKNGGTGGNGNTNSSGAGGGGAGNANNGGNASTYFVGVGGVAGGGDGAPGQIAGNNGIAATSTGGGAGGGYRTGPSKAGATGAAGQVKVSYVYPVAPYLQQTDFIFENDDATSTGDVDKRTQQASGSTTITSVKQGERLNVRLQLKNTGEATDNTTFGLFYDKNDNYWHKVTTSGVPTTTSVGNCTDMRWDCTAVDTANTVGYYTSIAFDPAGNPWVSYYDGTNGDLRFARYVGTGGTGCASSAWTCTAVDTANDIGWYTSIAFDPGGIPWVSYYDNTNGDLRVARYVGTGGTGCASSAWTCTAVDTANTVGWYTSIAFDPGGIPWVSYYDGTNGDLRVATLHDQGGEIRIAPSAIGVNATTTRESHSDMTSTSDNTNRDDADCSVGSVTWNNGQAFMTEEGTGVALGAGSGGSPKCTEISFTIDTAQATPGTTYRLVAATKDNWRPDKGLWRGVATTTATTSYATFTVESATTTARISKAALFQATSTCADSNWDCMLIDLNSNNNSISNGSSLAFDPTGIPWIAYGSYRSGSLGIARYVGSGGTGCAMSTWTCTTIDTAAMVDIALTLAFDPSGTPWIISYATTTGDLRVAKYVGSGGSGCTSTAWACTAVDTTNDAGLWNSLAFDPSGNPWVSYHDVTNNDLRVAKYVGSNGSGCTSAAWTCTAVDTTNIVGNGSSLAFDKNGTPWISFIDRTNNNLRVAEYVGSSSPSTACSGSSAWTCAVVVTNGGATFYDTSLVFDSGNNPMVSYYSTGPPAGLMLAKYVGSGGSGCTSAAWTCTAVDTNNDSQRPHMALDSWGAPWIEYRDNTASTLNVAKYVGSGGSGCSSSAWKCVQIDSSNSGAFFMSFAFDPNGIPWISYSDASIGYLRIAKLHLPPTAPNATSSGIRYPGRSARGGGLQFPLDSGKSPRTDSDGTCNANTDLQGYCSQTADDTSYDSLFALPQERPIYQSSFFATSVATPTISWVGRSSTAPSAKTITAEIYRFGSTQAWVTLPTTTNTCSSAASNTDCAITGAPTQGDKSEYFQAGMGGYYSYVRVWQTEGGYATTTFRSDLFTQSFASNPNMTIYGYRWRQDNGIESQAAALAAENAASQNQLWKGDRARLRITVSNTGGASATNVGYRLQYASSSCTSWIDVPPYASTTQAEWKMDLSQWVSEGTVTTNVGNLLSDPASQSFVPGDFRLYLNQSAPNTLTTAQFTEEEYSVVSTSLAQSGLSYCFRVTNQGDTTNFTYTQQPQATLRGDARPLAGGISNESQGQGIQRTGGGQGGGTGSEGSGSGGTPKTGGGMGGGGGDAG